MNNKRRMGGDKKLRRLRPMHISENAFVVIEDLLLPFRMKTDFWLINKNKCTFDSIDVFQKETASIYDLFLA